MGELEPYILGLCTVRICFSGTWNRTFLNFVRLGSSFQRVGTVHFQVCVRLDYLFLKMEPYHGLTVCCLYGYFPANELRNRTGLPRWPEQADSAENTRLPGFSKRIYSSGIMPDLFIFDRPGAAALSEISESALCRRYYIPYHKTDYQSILFFSVRVFDTLSLTVF